MYQAEELYRKPVKPLDAEPEQGSGNSWLPIVGGIAGALAGRTAIGRLIKTISKKEVPLAKAGKTFQATPNVAHPSGSAYADFEVNKNKVFLHDFYVDKSVRRQGLATDMMSQIEKEYPMHAKWTAATSPEMNALADRFKYDVARPKGRMKAEVPEEVNFSNATVRAKKPEVIPGRRALAMDDDLKANVKAWLMGETEERPIINFVFRGQSTLSKPKPVGKDYVHVTPWASVAARGGKGGFGDPTAHKVYVLPADNSMEFYRAGSLAGDPLERTRILNAKGMSWDNALDKAKELYNTELLRQAGLIRRDARARNFTPEDVEMELSFLSKNLANDVLDDFMRATFEADIKGRPGIWKGQTVPRELDKELPKLRSNEELREVLKQREKEGFPEEDIKNFPEAKILRGAALARLKESIKGKKLRYAT